MCDARIEPFERCGIMDTGESRERGKDWPMETAAAPIIEATGICKSFREGDRERVVFADATLSIARGEWVFLLGRRQNILVSTGHLF